MLWTLGEFFFVVVVVIAVVAAVFVLVLVCHGHNLVRGHRTVPCITHDAPGT